MKAIADATVSVVDGPDTGYAATTDGMGRYRLTGLKGGELTLVISAPNHAPLTSRVVLASNQSLDFQLGHSGMAYEVEGRVRDEDGSPLAGAEVSFTYSSPLQSSRYGQVIATSDSTGLYRVEFTAVPGGYAGSVAFVSTTKAGHDADNRWFRANPQAATGTLDFHLYRIRRITAGDSVSVSIAPNASLCFDNAHDSPGVGPDLLCRTIRVVAPADGVLTVEATSTSNGTRPNVVVETVSPASYQLKIGNPASVLVTAGTEVMANIELAASSLDRESYLLTSTITPRP